MAMMLRSPEPVGVAEAAAVGLVLSLRTVVADQWTAFWTVHSSKRCPEPVVGGSGSGSGKAVAVAVASHPAAVD